MFRFNGSQQEMAYLVETLGMERIRAEEPEPNQEPIPEPEPKPSPLPEPIPEEVPGRQIPGREVEDPNGPWVPRPTETPSQPEQPTVPTEVPPTIWPEQGG